MFSRHGARSAGRSLDVLDGRQYDRMGFNLASLAEIANTDCERRDGGFSKEIFYGWKRHMQISPFLPGLPPPSPPGSQVTSPHRITKYQAFFFAVAVCGKSHLATAWSYRIRYGYIYMGGKRQ